ncbi:response regulator transcription factor [Variovorax sp. YR752]|uniref:response regulator transcription factor n=1 Tax=Variovorax sp. YR752 TaxID=1884383 RepID=UPI003137E7F7
MSHRILVVEDHPLLRHGLRALLATQADYHVIDEAIDGREAVMKTIALQPDLVLMDLSLPGASGIDATAQIRRRLPLQKVLALSDYDSELHASEALRAGCVGCVKKDCASEEMLLAVKTVLAGRRFLGQDLASQLLDGVLHPGKKRSANPWDTLSSRERTIFKLIAEGGTNRSAAACLNLSAKTVEKHRANLMRKLHLNSALELVLLAVDLGLVQRPRLSTEVSPGAPSGVPA